MSLKHIRRSLFGGYRTEVNVPDETPWAWQLKYAPLEEPTDVPGPKLCINCEHHVVFGAIKPPTLGVDQCERNVVNATISLVTGKKYFTLLNCEQERMPAISPDPERPMLRCGPSGKYFRRKK